MRKLSFIALATLVILSTILMTTQPNSSADSTSEQNLKQLLPLNKDYQWTYSGIVEYGHTMSIQSIDVKEDETIYSITGEVYDASDGVSGADMHITLQYITKPDVLIQEKSEEMMMDSEFDRLELIRTPLKEGNSWSQTVTDSKGNQTTLKSTITNVTTDNGQKIYTVQYEDTSSDYYEERKIKEDVGVIDFKKLMTSKDMEDYEVNYHLYEAASGVVTDKKFTDVRDNVWYAPYLYPLVSLDIVHGLPDHRFLPNDSISVAEFLKLTLHSMSYHVENGSNVWYEPIINKAKELNLIEDNEYEDYTRPITRQEMVKILYQAFPSKTEEVELSFSDKNAIDKDYVKYVQSAVQLGFISGYDDNTFRPNDSTTRSEATKIFYLITLKNQQEALSPSTAFSIEKKWQESSEENETIALDEAEDYHVQMIHPRKMELTQESYTESYGNYRLEITYEYINDQWRITKRDFQRNDEELPDMNEVSFEKLGKNDVPKEILNKIEYVKEKRGYITFPTDNPNEVILYVASGEKPTGGFSIAVTEVERVGNQTQVTVKEKQPGPKDMVTQAFTYPTDIVLLKNPTDSIKIISNRLEPILPIDEEEHKDDSDQEDNKDRGEELYFEKLDIQELPANVERTIEQLKSKRGSYTFPTENPNEVILLISSGQKNTGGYGINVNSVMNISNKTIIDVKETEPAPGGIVSQAITYPMEVILIGNGKDNIEINTNHIKPILPIHTN